MIPATAQSHLSVQSPKFVTVDVDPNDPFLFQPSEDADPQLNPIGMALWRAGVDKGIDMLPKAIAASDCQTFYSSLFCKNGHDMAKMICYRCKLRFAECCAEYNLKVRVAKRMPLIEQLQAIDLYQGNKMVKVTIHVRGERTVADRSMFQRGVHKMFGSMMSWARKEWATFYEHSTNGHVQGCYIATGMFFTEDWKALVIDQRTSWLDEAIKVFGNRVVRVGVHRVTSALEVKEVFTTMYRVIIPGTTKGQAEMETLYHGVPLNDQGAQNPGSFLIQPPKDSRNEQGLSLEEALHERGTVPESVSDDKVDPRDRRNCCFVCGEKAAFMTTRHLHSATSAEIARLPRNPLRSRPPN